MEVINDNSLNKNLLDLIKSKYILKQIFNHLKNKTLLQIIRYNKNLQKKLNKTKTHYKREYFNIIIEIIPEENILKNHAEILTKKRAYFPHHGIVSHGDSGYEFTFINIKKKYKSYFHIYFNDDLNKEIKRDYITEKDKVSKIKIIIDYKIKSLSRLFKTIICIKSINFIKFKNKNINNMSHLFESCSLKKINFSNFITKNVTDMRCMFMSCEALGTVPEYNLSKCTDISKMFSGCGNLIGEFPWEIDMSSITSSAGVDSMFKNTRITKVTFKNVPQCIQELTPTAIASAIGNANIVVTIKNTLE